MSERKQYMFFILIAVSVLAISSRHNVMAGNQEYLGEPKENTVANVDFINGDFEYPNIMDENQYQIPGSRFSPADLLSSGIKWNYIPMGVDPDFGWYTEPVDASSTNIWRYYVELHHNFRFEANTGLQNAELSADIPGRLYQYCNTVPGQKIYYEFFHRGVEGEDRMNFYLCKPGAGDGLIRECKSDQIKWQRYYGAVTIPDDQKITEFAFEAVSSASSGISTGNLLDSIRLFYPAFLEVSHEVESPHDGYALPGERVTYRIEITNTGEAESSRTVVTDILPDGVQFKEETVKMIYINKDGTEEEIMITDQVSYDSESDILTIEAGKKISGQVLKDENDNEYPNDYANGSCAIEKHAVVVITFAAEVTGAGISFGSEIKNQVKVTYNDLGYEEFNLDENGVLQDDYNVSEVVSFLLYSRVELVLKKELPDISKDAERFYFLIECYEEPVSSLTRTFYAEVVVPAGAGDGETILNSLMPGYYIVKELDNRWYYQIDSSTDRIQDIHFDGAAVLEGTLFYKNKRESNGWIDGNNYITNEMKRL